MILRHRKPVLAGALAIGALLHAGCAQPGTRPPGPPVAWQAATPPGMRVFLAVPRSEEGYRVCQDVHSPAPVAVSVLTRGGLREIVRPANRLPPGACITVGVNGEQVLSLVQRGGDGTRAFGTIARVYADYQVPPDGFRTWRSWHWGALGRRWLAP